MNNDFKSEQQEKVLSVDKLVRRQGRIVFRPSGSWTPSVHALLKHLKQVGFSEAPRIIDSGIDPNGREMLSYVEGEMVHPYAWSDEGLLEVGMMLRRLHDLTSSFQPPANAEWQPWFLRELGGPNRVIGHGDLAPWNVVTRDGKPVGLIDWEYAGPIDPMIELARVCWLFPQLHDDDVAELYGLPGVEVRARQLRLLVDAYGASSDQRSILLNHIIEVVVREAAEEAILAHITRESVGRQWGLAWRIRSAAWILRHRRVIERVLA